PELEPDEPSGGAVAPATPHPAPLPRRTLPRSHPRQEPSALAAHAGICAGGRPQGRSLPRSTPVNTGTRRSLAIARLDRAVGSIGLDRRIAESCLTRSSGVAARRRVWRSPRRALALRRPRPARRAVPALPVALI